MGRLFGQAARPAGGAFGAPLGIASGEPTHAQSRDAVTARQNDNRREGELYRRIFRQLGQRSRKGDPRAGVEALNILERARNAGYDPTGISSFDEDRSFAEDDLARDAQVAAAFGNSPAGGVYTAPPAPTQAASPYYPSTTLPTSRPSVPMVSSNFDTSGGATPFPQPTPVPTSSSIETDIVGANSNPLPPAPPIEIAPTIGSARQRRPGETGNGTINGIPTDQALIGSARQRRPGEVGNGMINGRPTDEVLGRVPPSQVIENQFARDYPATTEFLRRYRELGVQPVPESPEAEGDFEDFERVKATEGRETALRLVSERARNRVQDKHAAEREARHKDTSPDARAAMTRRDGERTGLSLLNRRRSPYPTRVPLS